MPNAVLSVTITESAAHYRPPLLPFSAPALSAPPFPSPATIDPLLEIKINSLSSKPVLSVLKQSAVCGFDSRTCSKVTLKGLDNGSEEPHQDGDC